MMKRLMLIVVMIAAALNIPTFSATPKHHLVSAEIGNDDIEGVYILDKSTRKSKRILKGYNKAFSITISLKKDHEALIEVLRYPDNNKLWGRYIGEGIWDRKGDTIHINLTKKIPPLYPIQDKSGEIGFMAYPYSRVSVIGSVTLQIGKKNDKLILTSQTVRLDDYSCGRLQSCVRLYGKCDYIKTDAPFLKTWQERVSEKIETLPGDTYPRNLNPLPVEIGTDSTLKIIDKGKEYYEAHPKEIYGTPCETYSEYEYYLFYGLPEMPGIP